MKKIILISGSSFGAGKDYFATLLAEECVNKSLRPRIMRFGDWVKDSLVRYYNWDGKKDEAGRHLLQSFATDEVRAYDKDYWAEVTYRLAAATQKDWDILLIPDLRFPNEFYTGTKFFNQAEMLSIRVERNLDTSKDENRNHISEHSMEEFVYDVIIDNNGTTEQLREKASQLLDKIIIA